MYSYVTHFQALSVCSRGKNAVHTVLRSRKMEPRQGKEDRDDLAPLARISASKGTSSLECADNL